jgi:hypothetical protein
MKVLQGLSPKQNTKYTILKVLKINNIRQQKVLGLGMSIYNVKYVNKLLLLDD